ncbi:MAG TPA: helix-turn-helix domain-containing protein [bacterium]
MTTLLVADDEQTFLDFMVRLLQKDYQLLIARNWTEVLEKFEANLWRLNATILDVNMPGLSVDPFAMVEKLLKSNPTIPMVIISGQDIVLRHEFLRMGVFHYHGKPIDMVDLKLTIRNATEYNRVMRKLEHFERDNRDDVKYYQRLLKVNVNDIAEKIRGYDSPVNKVPVLIRTEAGTKPYMLAKVISLEVDNKLFFKKVCSENLKNIVPHNLQHGDTLYLEGIEKLANEEHAYLLKLLDHLEGAEDTNESFLPKFRLIVSTSNRGEAELNSSHTLSQLLQRLSKVEFRVEPLRLRKHELREIVSLVFEKLKKDRYAYAETISDDLYELFADYSWPLNYDELHFVLDSLLTTCPDSSVHPKHLHQLDFSDIGNSKYPTLDEMISEHIKKTLRRTMGNKSKAAKMLGITPKTLYARMRD